GRAPKLYAVIISAMTVPPWVPEAVGSLVSAAVLGLPVVWWKNRSRWIRRLALAVWIPLVVVLAYYIIRGNLGTLVPPFLRSVPGLLTRSVPAWWLLLLVLAGSLVWRLDRARK